jgi:hypothetical protein
VGVILSGVTIGYLHVPPAFQRREHHAAIVPPLLYSILQSVREDCRYSKRRVGTATTKLQLIRGQRTVVPTPQVIPTFATAHIGKVG